MAKETNVLFLDDDEIILKLASKIFTDATFNVATAINHEEAIKVISNEEIKVIVSDQLMPDITGIEFLTRVKNDFPFIIRIILTGNSDIEVTQDAINQAEVFRFLNKPFDNKQVKGIVLQAIQHYDLVANKELYESTLTENVQLQDLNRTLNQLYERQKEFSSTVSHELRTPLASIKTALEIILSGSTGDLSDKQKEFIGTAKRNVDRLRRLINDILDLSKLEAGKLFIKKGKYDINITIDEIVESQKIVAEKKNLYMKTNLDQSIPLIPFDIDKISQVLNNLIDNALKFTDKGGIIIESVNHKKSNHVRINVKDTGIGFHPEDRSKLFKKFQQLKDPAFNETGGTGLGLSICKEIITQHGGKIDVESVPEKGSCFYIILPIEERRKR